MNETVPQPVAPSTPATDASCVACAAPCPRLEQVRCSSCKAVHHLDCWRKNRGCAAETCACRISERVAEREPFERDDEDKEHWFAPDADGSLVIISHVLDLEEPVAGGTALGCGGVAFGWLFSYWTIYTYSWWTFGVGLTLFLLIETGFRHRVRINAFGGAIERSLLFFGKALTHDRGHLFLDELVELHLHSKEQKDDDEEDEEDETEHREESEDPTADASPSQRASEVEKPLDSPSLPDGLQPTAPAGTSTPIDATASDDTAVTNGSDSPTVTAPPNPRTMARKKKEKKKKKKKPRPPKFRYELFGVNLEGERKPLFVRTSRDRAFLHRAVEQIAQAANCTVRHYREDETPSKKDIADAIEQHRLAAPLHDEQRRLKE